MLPVHAGSAWISSGNGSWNSARTSSRVQLWRTWPRQALEKDNACARDIQFAQSQSQYRQDIHGPSGGTTGHDAEAVEFSAGGQFRGHHKAAKLVPP